MKKYILASLLLGSSATIQADYIMKWPIEGVKFVAVEWTIYDPIITEWVNSGSIYDCINWQPLQESKYVEVNFTQTSSECKQNQTRTVQNRQINSNTEAVRNVGNPITETQSIAASSSQSVQGTSHSWSSFAEYKGLSTNWTSLDWGNKGLTSLPSDNYPVSVVTGNLYFNNNPLRNLNSLVSITAITGYLGIYESSLTNLDGLINVRTIGQTLSVRNNALTSISGLANVAVGGVINIDKSYSGPKLPANSRFCTLNAANKFATTTNYAPKTQLCL